MIVMAYLLLAAAVASLVALVFVAMRASSRPPAARTAGAEHAVLGLLGAIFVVTAAAVGTVLGWKISAPNDDC